MILEHIKLGIDCKNNFKIDYNYDNKKSEVISNIKKAAKDAEVIYAASDSDNEGYYISEEIKDLLKQYEKKIIRITFNEITEDAVKDAIKNPVGFNKSIADAAETRTVIDKLLGYRCSPVVLSKIGAPSAGRVQSALLHLLAEKEKTIRAFIPEKYYNVFLEYWADKEKTNSSLFKAKLCKIGRKSVDKIADSEIVNTVLNDCSFDKFVVESVLKKEKLLKPKLPMTTASLQQLSSNVNGWSPSRTQRSAQMLFEKGLITYIRTDAVRFAPEFIESAEKFILKKFGKEYYAGLNIPKEKNEKAQNAHESIRPTNLEKEPKNITNVSDDEIKLYKLIYNYTLASFFVPAIIEETDIIIKNKEYLFKTSMSKILSESFLTLTHEFEHVDGPFNLVEKQEVFKKSLTAEAKETLPPPRYSEAGLVKLMQETGIGRPSTFSTTIETLKKREYIIVEKKSVAVTDMGLKLDAFLEKYFTGIFNPEYTAELETILDKIAVGEETEEKTLKSFWEKFEPIVLKAVREANKDKAPAKEVENQVCPQCGKKLVYRKNRMGTEFIACSGFPRCRFTAKNIESINKKEESQEEKQNLIKCPLCKVGHMVKRKNKKGEEFWGCSRFVKGCKNAMSMTEMEKYLTNLVSVNLPFSD